MGKADESSETSDESGSESARRLSLRNGGLRSKHSLHFLPPAGLSEGMKSTNTARRQKVQNQKNDIVIFLNIKDVMA
jgi:hypothetical protein